MILCIFNEKGGVGKTTVTVNLAVTVAQNYRVLLIDLDPLKTAASFFISPTIQDVPTIYDVLFHDVPLHSAAIEIYPTFFVVPAADEMRDASNALRGAEMPDFLLSRIIQEAQESPSWDFDVIVLDMPGKWDEITSNAILAATHHLIPVNCEQTALDATAQVRGASNGLFGKYGREPHPRRVLLTSYKPFIEEREVEKSANVLWEGQVLTTNFQFSRKIKQLSRQRKTVNDLVAGTAREDFKTLKEELEKLQWLS